MGEKRRRGGGDLLPEEILIQILVRLPGVSLLRFKDVCKYWLALIESSFFTDLYFKSSSSSSSNKKFGSFILHAAVDFENFREDAVFMLSSSESESESESSRWSESSAGYLSWCLWPTGFNGVCGKCDSAGSGGSGWRWSTNNEGRCRTCGKWNNILGRELSNDDDDDDQQQQQQQQLVFKLGNLGFPSCYSFGKPPTIVMVVVGSCNGIICLYDEQSNEFSLWNPVTRQFRILPKPSSSSSSSITTIGNVHRLFAFGFDDETKDYKVVLLSVSNRRMLDFVMKDEPAAPMECICQVEVYSSSTDSWKLLKGITSLPASPFPYPPDSSYSSGLFYLNGSCFFMAKLLYSSSSSEEEEEQCIPPPKNDDRFMISLDLTNESITPIELADHHHRHQLFLCYLGKKIAFLKKQWVYDSTGSWESFYISVFNEQYSSVVGGKPWEYLSHFEIKKLGLPGERYIPRGISNDGVFVFLETEMLETEIRGGLDNNKKKKKMKLYDLVTKEVKENFLSCDQVLSKAFPYKPSLVSFPYKAAAAAAAAAADMVIGKAAECSNSQPMIID